MLEQVTKYRPTEAYGASVLAEIVSEQCNCLVMYIADKCIDTKKGEHRCFKIYKDESVRGAKVVRGKSAYNKTRRVEAAFEEQANLSESRYLDAMEAGIHATEDWRQRRSEGED